MQQSRRALGDPESVEQASSGEVQRWTRARKLFLKALEHPNSERRAFVAQASAHDPALRNEVESLLESDGLAENYFELPAASLLGFEGGPASEAEGRLPPGTRLGAYEITDFIAAGGMGSVYRARHTVLGRQVAIKTVSTRVTSEAARRRLIREARHAANLAHPNICAIHDVGETDGLPFIVMELVDGLPLREIVRKNVPTFEDSLRYGIQIAGALKHAHEHGIIHRDLKSSNVVIDAEDKAIVLDFGLARRLPGSADAQMTDATITEADSLAGTVSYMAPEVLRGERGDARSDVWALGVLLYEMATGDLPYKGRTPFETSSAILGDPLRPFSTRVPLALRLVIEHCLIKDPLGRYQSARAVRAALDAIRRKRAWPIAGRLLISARRRSLYVTAATVLLFPFLVMAARALSVNFQAAPIGQVSALALLPLENATGDPRNDFYADGLTDALIGQLGGATHIRVLSRASINRIAGTAGTPAQIGEQLAADAIIRGELRRAGQRVTVHLWLVRPSDGRVVWSETYDRQANEVLALQADGVRGIVNAVQLTLRPDARERLVTTRAVSPAVYEAYLKGRYEWNRRTPESLERAIDYFSRAVELDPTYAPAHAALADCFNQLATVLVGGGSPRSYRPRAAAEAIKALQLDPYSAEAHATLGYVWHYDWRWADAEKHFRRAIELNPSYALAHVWYANMLMSRLRMDEALAHVYVAREIDPFSLVVNTNVAWVLNNAKRHDAAIAQLKRTLMLDSTYVQAHWRLAHALASAGRFSEALEAARRVVALTDSSSSALAGLAVADAMAGRRREARALLDELLLRSARQYVPPALVALVFDALGDVDNTLIWLEKAFAERSNAIAYLAVDYQHDPVQRDPRFQSLLARAGLK